MKFLTLYCKQINVYGHYIRNIVNCQIIYKLHDFSPLDMNLGRKYLVNLILENPYEAEILQIITTHGFTIISTKLHLYASLHNQFETYMYS